MGIRVVGVPEGKDALLGKPAACEDVDYLEIFRFDVIIGWMNKFSEIKQTVVQKVY